VSRSHQRPYDRRASRFLADDVVEAANDGWLGRERELAVAPGDFIAVLSAGAYAMSMASNYNTRPRAAEVMVSGREASLIRERESLADLLRGERLLDPADPTPT